MYTRRAIFLACHLLLSQLALEGAEYHVSLKGADANPGSLAKPFRTIQKAAEMALPGDTVTVHEGVYREHVNPPRGGASEDQRIVFRAAPGADVTIKGSEVVDGWVKEVNDTWKVVLENSSFGDYNPYGDKISGDWFKPKGRVHSPGSVLLNGHWLVQARDLDAVMQPADPEADDLLWFATVDDGHTTIRAQFRDTDPNQALVEVTYRRAVFYPDSPGRNFITVRGFTLEHAATPWAPPTAEQVGLIGTHWSKGWIIEHNTIRYSACVGVTLGKYGDEWDNRSQSADAYNRTIERALKNGWSKEKIGGHMVRNNHISHCEQAGIVGSMGAVFSTIRDNHIHDIHVRALYDGAEMAGIKIHAPIDVLIQDNHIHSGYRGIWLDWMTQGARVTGNLLHDHREPDLFVEVNHGPFVIDNNIFLSENFLRDWSSGGTYAHNLAFGTIEVKPQVRETPYHKPHSTEIAGLHKTPCGDNRFYNNLFLDGLNLDVYGRFSGTMSIEGNVFTDGSVELKKKNDGYYLVFESAPEESKTADRRLVETEGLGLTRISKAPFLNPDASRLSIDKDFFGMPRDRGDLKAGPFSTSIQTGSPIKVSPKNKSNGNGN